MNMRELGFAGLAALACAATLQAWPAFAQQAKARPTPTVNLPQLIQMRGPYPPRGAVYLGQEAQPMVGSVQLPLKNVGVFQFPVRTQRGDMANVNWSYSAGKGTYMWASAPLQCADGSVLPNGSYAIRVRDNGSGGYLLGSNQCPVGQAFGCEFNAQGVETTCGACAWNESELVCGAR